MGNIKEVISSLFTKHCKCLLFMLLIILVSIITIGLLTDNRGFDALGIASAVVSIILGVVVIIYTMIQNSEMKDLISDVPKVITYAVNKIFTQIETIKKDLNEFISTNPLQSSLTGTTEWKGDKFDFNPSVCKQIDWVFLYYMTQALKREKKLSLVRFAKFYADVMAVEPYEEDKKVYFNYMRSYIQGFLNGFGCFLPCESYKIDPKQHTLTVNTLPTTLVDYINEQVQQLQQGEGPEYSNAQKILNMLENCLLYIENH